LAVVAIAHNIDSENVNVVFEFQAWATQYGKSYPDTNTWEHAFHNFQMNTKRVAEFAASNPEATFGMTKFADLSAAEFKAKYLTARIDGLTESIRSVNPSLVAPRPSGTPPATWDWRKENAVTAVKNQGDCGSCWAFSTTENVESMWFLANHTLPILGPQQLVDCDPQSQGCNGGWTYWAFEYLMTAGGLESEKSYPYTGENGNCKFAKSKIVADLKNYSFAIPPCESGACTDQDMTLLRSQLAEIGPLSICVDAEPWQLYSSGILSNCPMDAGDIDHCVQLVGYNWPSKYWIVRNSWAEDWGIDGYIWLSTAKNTCGMGDVVTYAIV